MKIFIDDSGGFGWNPPGVSLFCALTISDKSFREVVASFSAWRQRQRAGPEGAEVKGSKLTSLQQASFASTVVLASGGLAITLAGTDTSRFEERLARMHVQDSASILRASARKATALGKPAIADFAEKMARWVGRRSSANLMWLLTLVDVVMLSLNHSIAVFADNEHASEFEEIEIQIDESFVKPKQDGYWKEWLRSFLFENSLRRPFWTVKQWPETHPFRRKYCREGGLLDTSDLFRNHTSFVDSRESEGVQIADICANICFRRYSGNRKYRPYRLLRPRIIGERGSGIHYGILDGSSLLTDSPENHAHFYTEEDLAGWVREAREERA